MSAAALTHSGSPDTATQAKARAHFLKQSDVNHRHTDRLFVMLMICQYAGAIITSLTLGRLTWAGSEAQVNPHVWTALILGGLIAGPVFLAARLWPGSFATRCVVAVCQMLMSALLIHLSGGRIETHFHVFGSLAFLAFYRDWRILIPATLVVLLDHVIRGIYFPASVYGVSSGAELRFIEHAGWVVFENVILVASINRGVRESQELANRQALIEAGVERVEALVDERTLELRASEKRNRAIIQSSLDAILVTDEHGSVVSANPAAEDMLGIDAAFVGDLNISAFLPEEIQRFVGARRDILARRLDGEPFPAEVSVVESRTEAWTLRTVSMRDMTEQQKLREKLGHAQKMETIGQLSAGIAHEINTPNQYIGDNVNFLSECTDALSRTITEYQALVEETAPSETTRREEIDTRNDLAFYLDEAPKAVEQAREGVSRVQEIVRAMRDFAHPGVENWTEVDLNRVVESTITVSRGEWRNTATLKVDLHPKMPMLQGHPSEIGRIVLNLITNAVHAVTERHGLTGGEILVRTLCDGQRAYIEVSDNGNGVPEPIRQQIWLPFFTTKGVGIGTGQGLAISRSVVERHGGEISLETGLGEGAKFTVALPLTQPYDMEEAA
jgi:PAS domain S-box-containing protein